MSTHPVIDYDPDLVSAIADRLDLRTPNAAALDAVAQRTASAAGTTFEAVTEMATAVGKTYLAAGLIEYYATQGIRNIVIVCPGRTVLTKTIANFTPGSRKAVPGMETDYFLVTADNFRTGAAAAAYQDDSKVKLFVFTVQALLEPTSNTVRKTREFQEWLGGDFIGYLTRRDDLIVIADEHHTYAQRAESFNAALSELRPMAIIGLTATADATQKQYVVYDYPLAAALRDKLVKTPVLVGRTDDHHDLGTRLSDGLTLLRAKQTAADKYQLAHNAAQVNPVMLVVCDSIDQADMVTSLLKQPNLLGDDAERQVLTIHSQSPDDALAQLADVEEPDSPVRVIISVSMLKEGWDVKNVYVILSLRPSVSDTLTEQTLGRGLRLPYGARTGDELLDTVEVISHDRFEKLLAAAGILIKGITAVRAAGPPQPTPAGPSPVQPAAAASATPIPAEASAAAGGPAVVVAAPGTDLSGDANVAAAAASSDAGVTALPGLEPGQVPGGFLIASTEDRIAQAQATADASIPVPALPGRGVKLPKVTRTMGAANFSLSSIDDSAFAEIGRKVAGAHDAKLDRKLLEVEDDGHGGFQLVPRPGKAIDAAVVSLPLGSIRDTLIGTVMAMDFVPETQAQRNAAARLVDAAIAAAGGEERIATYHEAALKLIQRTLRSRFKGSEPVMDEKISLEPFAPPRQTVRRKDPNRFGAFDRQAAYSGWERSLHGYNWFDSAAERQFANLLDADITNDGVQTWCRIQRGEFHIDWREGRYTPDFFVHVGDVQYLVEVKGDWRVNDPDVQAKKTESKRLARAITDEGTYGDWRYVLIAEEDLDNLHTVGDLLAAAAG